MSTPIKWGEEFLVNATTYLAQLEPTVTALANGRFILIWTDSSATGSDTSGTAIRAQQFNADGSKHGGEILVNTTTTSEQSAPAVTALPDGRFTMAWADYSQAVGSDNSLAAVRAQTFNLDGSKYGSEFLVNTTITESQWTPALATLAGGHVVAGWTDNSNSRLTGYDVRAQILNADGSKVGGEFVVNTATSNTHQSGPAVAGLSNGDFVVAWSDDSLYGTLAGMDVHARIFDADGNQKVAEFVVNTTTIATQSGPALAALASGHIVVAWRDDSLSPDDDSIWAVRAQVFDNGGNKYGTEFLVNTTTIDAQFEPAVAALADGRFVVAWTDSSQSDGDTSYWAVRAQAFNLDGSKSGSEFLVNTTTLGQQHQPTVSTLPDGRFVVGWTDASGSDGDTSGQAVRAQIFDPRESPVAVDGTALSDHFIGTPWRDTLYGSAGNDTLDGAGGADILYGGPGNDTYSVDGAADVVWEPGTASAIVRVGSALAMYGTHTQAISADGRYVAFYSISSQLVAGDTNEHDDVFVADLGNGLVTRVSTSGTGDQANDDSSDPALSADGRYVVFESSASNLVEGDANLRGDVFLKDRETGATTRVDTSSTGAEANYGAERPAISGDGRYVVFESGADTLVPADSNARGDIFLKDLQTGVTVRVSTSRAGAEADDDCFAAVISADGRYVAFHSAARTLVSGDEGPFAYNDDVFVKNVVDGTVVRASANALGVPGNGDSQNTAISADGRYVAFVSMASNLVADDTNDNWDIFVKDLMTGLVQRVNTSSTGAQASYPYSTNPEISADGRFVAFESDADNLVPGDSNLSRDVFVKDLRTGAIACASAGAATSYGGSFNAAISVDGRFISFVSYCSNFVPGDADNTPDVFRVANPLLAGSGTDTVRTAISHVLGANIENLVLTGVAAVNGTGNALNNSLVGNTGANSLQGLTGNDTLNGGLGNDTLNGGVGSDTASYATAAKGVTVSLAIATAQATGMGLDRLIGLENLGGGNYADRLTGNSAANTLTGLGGKDTLTGNAGNDKLVGGLGNDALNGGLGKDVFRFDTAANTLTNRDTIAGFSVVDDTLQLENAVFTKVGLPGTLAAAAFWKSATAIAAHDATDRVIYNTTTGALYYDPDGTGPLAKVQFATLAGSPDTVTNADFQVT